MTAPCSECMPFFFPASFVQSGHLCTLHSLGWRFSRGGLPCLTVPVPMIFLTAPATFHGPVTFQAHQQCNRSSKTSRKPKKLWTKDPTALTGGHVTIMPQSITCNSISGKTHRPCLSVTICNCTCSLVNCGLRFCQKELPLLRNYKYGSILFLFLVQTLLRPGMVCF